MRQARIADLRRQLSMRHSNAAPRITLLRLEGLPGFANVELAPNTGFLAICGGTGLGKSALLEAIRLIAEPVSIGIQQGSDRLSGATITATIEHQGQEYRRSRTAGIPTADDDGFPNGIAFVGLADRTTVVQSYFRDLDIDVIKTNSEPIEVGRADLANLAAICRKEYESAQIFEIDGAGDEVLPFIEISDGGVKYDTRSMATGELSAFYLFWTLQRAEPFSLVLMEEPESYLPPLSHESIFALICDHALRRRLGIFITTHSTAIASQIPQANLLSIRRKGGLSTLPTTGESKSRILSRLGLGPQKHAVLFVEDQLAHDILSEILARFEFKLICRVEIVNTSGGDGAVKTALEGLPTGIGSVKFLGVLDGDVADVARKWKCAKSLIFLPFAKQMETELLSAIESKPGRLGRLLTRENSRIEDALLHSAGTDSHDRLKSVAEELGVPFEALTHSGLEVWSKISGNRARMTRFARELAAEIGIELPSPE